MLDGAIFNIAFIACLLWSIPGMISGFWMPYLYVLPFSCYVYALALLSMNKLRSSREKVILFVSLGLLIHGHSSFIGLTVIGFLISIICGFCSRHFNFRSMLSAVTNLARPRFILLIPALFLAPIVIDMFVNFPGEVPSYFDYAMKVVRNDFIESVRFSLTFFPGGRRMVPFFAGACVMSYFWARQIPLRCSQRARDCNALQDLELACLCFFLTLSLAVTYAYRGIDGLENINKYTIFWTSGGYALAASFLVLSLSNLLINRKISSFLHFSGQSRRILSAWLVAVLVAIYLFLSPAGQGVGMRSSSVEDLSHYISDLKQSRHLTIVRINYQEHMQWPEVAGLLLDLKRKGVEACTTWRHMAFLYTDKMICPAGDEWDVKLIPVDKCHGGCSHVSGTIGLVLRHDEDDNS